MVKPFNKSFIKKVKKDIEKSVTDKMDKIGLVAHARLVKATPTDIGQARAGWNFSLNHADPSTPPKIKRPKGTSGPLIEPPTTKLPSPQAMKLGDSYHISNFVEHTLYLNEGVPIGTQHSEQAELNFIETQIIAAIKSVK